MKRMLPAAIMLIMTTQIFASGWLPDRFLVLFKPEIELNFQKGDDGFVRTGIPEIDSLMVEFKIFKAKKLFPKATNPIYAQKRYPVRNQSILYTKLDSSLIPDICKRFEQSRFVILADPDHIYEVCAIPNDPRLDRQWYIDTIDAKGAWDFTRGSRNVIATNIEGVQWYHPDIYDNLWVNPGEDLDHDGVPMDPDDMNGIDDDGNGYIDDLIGWDFIEGLGGMVVPGEDGEDQDNNPDDFDGHGTHTIGVIGAVGNNHVGIAGINWRISLMILRSDYLGPHGGRHETAAEIGALQYAYEKGINVLSLSFGDTLENRTAKYYLRRLWYDNVIIFAAAGNDNISVPHYPSYYDFIIAVAALNSGNRKAYFSNYGTWVDVSAPGVSIYSTRPNSTYVAWDGTSMATPVAAGVGALLCAFFPDSSNEFWRRRVEEGVDDIYSVNPTYRGLLGSGKVNANKALTAHMWPNISIAIDIMDGNDDGLVEPGETAQVFVEVSNKVGWQPAESLIVELKVYDESILLVDSISYFGTLYPGSSVDNLSHPLKFTVAEGTYAHHARIHFFIKCPPQHYQKYAMRWTTVGIPQFLVYDCDSTNDFEEYILQSFDRGNVFYNFHSRSSSGELDSTVLNGGYAAIWILTCDNSTNIFSAEEISVFKAAADHGMGLVLTGQYAGDFLASFDSAFLADYFGAVHVDDAVPRVWAFNIEGISGDSITDGILLNCFTASDAAGNQVSLGTCALAPSGIGILRYRNDTDPTHFAATRKVLPSGAKNLFFEFGLEGVVNNTVGYDDRDSLIARIVRWYGFEYVGVNEELHSKPKASGIEIKVMPNPFNSTVRISFDLDTEARALIMDLNGRVVRSFGTVGSGNNTILWDGRDDDGKILPSGMYIFILNTGNKVYGKKVGLIR